MLLKLNEGEGVTVQANHSDVSNSYCINNFEGKVIQCREFPSGDNPPKSEQGDSKNNVQQTQPVIPVHVVKKLICDWVGPCVMEEISKFIDEHLKQQAGA